MKQTETKILKGQVAVVVGGLGGLGKIVVSRLEAAGAKVAVIDAVPRQENFFGGSNLYFFSAFVEDIGKIKAAFKKIYRKFGRIDIVVNCAGVIGPIGQFHTNSSAEWDRAFNINLFGTVNVCHAALPYLIKRKQGKIINFAGGGAVEPFPNFSAYASSKAAVVRFSENLAREYAASNIQVNTVAPGMIYTQLVKNLLSAGQDKVGRDYYRKVLEKMKTGGDDINTAADLVLFLANKKNKLTGKLISAKWDPWENFEAHRIEKLNQAQDYTLRRIDKRNFYEK